MSDGCQELWGELRSWHAQEHLRGRHLGPLFERWSLARPEEFTGVTLPYCLEQIRQRPEKSVHPYSPVPYSSWLDRLLEAAMTADRERRDEDAIRAYEAILCFKPDCVPAHLNLYRLRHRHTPIRELIAAHDWEAHGPYGSDSWHNVSHQLTMLDPRSRTSDDEPGHLAPITRSLMMDVEHQSTLYPSTLAAIQLIIMLMDREEHAESEALSASAQRQLASFLLDLFFYTLFSPYHSHDLHELSSRDEERRRKAIAQFCWPVAAMWSFIDPIIKRFPDRHQAMRFARTHHTMPEGASRAPVAELFFDRRSYYMYVDDGARAYRDYEVCKLPCLSGASFWRAEQNLVLEHISMHVYQAITAGIPVFERFYDAHHDDPEDNHHHEALLWHLGHFARRSQDRIKARIRPEERYKLSA